MSEPSIPSAGDAVIIPHPYVYDRHVIVRIAKVGKVMWEVEQWSRGLWGNARWQKVTTWLCVDPSTNMDELADRLRNAHDELFKAEKRVQAEYRASIERIAQGTLTRSAESEGLSPKDSGPVPQECAQTPLDPSTIAELMP